MKLSYCLSVFLLLLVSNGSAHGNQAQSVARGFCEISWKDQAGN